MRNSEYWAERALNESLMGERSVLEYENTLLQAYTIALREIQKDIDAFYTRYAKQHKISYAEARKRLTSQELKQFHALVKSRLAEAQQNGWSAEYIKFLQKLLSAKYISRLEMLEADVRHEIEVIEEGKHKDVTELLSINYLAAYYDRSYTIAHGADVAVRFSAITKAGVEQAVRTKWSQYNYSQTIWNDRDKLVRTMSTIIPQSFSRGLSSTQLGDMIAKEMNASKNRGRALARTEVNYICNQADLAAYKAVGIEEYELLATLDARTSEICRSMDGTIHKVKDAKVGINLPPLHVNCYDKDTEVYTDSGWKLFKDVTLEDKIWALNPETRVPEFISPKKRIQYHYQGKMLKFCHKSFNLLVTPDHNMFIKYTGDGAADRFRFVPASKVPAWNNSYYRGCEWVGVEPKTIKLGQYDVSPELFCRFMGWYLSEGSYSTRNDKQQGWQVGISQFTRLSRLQDDLKGFPVPFRVYNKRKDSSGIYFSDRSIYEYVQQFGRSPDKFVPDTIKQLSPRLIKIFLDSFCLGDGTVAPGSTWDGYKCRDAISFFTSSIRLRDDLGELIMKCGGRPTFKLPPGSRAGTPCFNGAYTMNNDVWVIRWNTKVWSHVENLRPQPVDYDDDVYCLELPKYHVMLVKREGQVVWCGNCRTCTIPHFDDQDVADRVARDENGKTITVPRKMSQEEYINTYIPEEDRQRLLSFRKKFCK